MINKHEKGGTGESEPEKNIEASKETEYTKTTDLTPEQMAHAQEWLNKIEEVPVPETKSEDGPEIIEFEALVAPYETEQTMGELMAITDAKEAMANPLRQEVKKALIPVLKKLQEIEQGVQISPEKLAELKARYKKLSSAVGMLNSGMVDHTR